jgi:hypothetical protein
MPTKHPIEDLISSVYQLIDQKDNERLEIAFKRLCAEFNAICKEETPYMINLQFQAMAAIVRSQLYADQNDGFVAEEMQMIRALYYVYENELADPFLLMKLKKLVNEVVLECNAYYQRREINMPVPDLIKELGQKQRTYPSITHEAPDAHPCYLCEAQQATCKGSHLAPHFLIQTFLSVDGTTKRGKEVVTETILGELRQDRKWGRNVHPEDIDATFGGVPDEEKETIKSDALTRDDYFCEACEKRFSYIEAEYADYFFKRKKTIRPEISYLFWLSVFWRLHKASMCIRLNDADEERIRDILDTYLPYSPKEVAHISLADHDRPLHYVLLHCEDTRTELLGLVGDHSTHAPYTILCGQYVLKIYSADVHTGEKYPVNDYREPEQCVEIPFIDWWKCKYDILASAESKECRALGANSHALIDLVKGDHVKGFPDFSLNGQRDHILNRSSHQHALFIPGPIAKVVQFQSMCLYQNEDDFWRQFTAEYGYTRSEIEQMQQYWEDHSKVFPVKTHASTQKHQHRKAKSKAKTQRNARRHNRKRKK